MRLLQFLLRPIYYLLYHQLAWTYDFVAALVSLGHWNEWVAATLPYIHGERVLEIGHGPGHLQLALQERGCQTFGLDESRQMSRQARRHLLRKGIITNLTRGLAQRLPYASGTFHSVALTFPSEYIFDPKTLTEIQRVLKPGGELVILPFAWLIGRRPLEKTAAWLLRVAGEVPGKPGELDARLISRFAHAGLEVRQDIIQQGVSLLLFIIAEKK
jgi:ubiquinone/menaquinone biosynthesis C-methylase UbiE